MLKSTFITVYLTIAIFVMLGSIYGLIIGEPWLPLVSILLTSGPISLVIAQLFLMQNRARTDANLRGVTGLTGLGLALAFYGFFTQQAPIEYTVTAFVMAGSFLLYNFWYSRLDRSDSQLTVGKPLPAFTLEANDDERFSSASLEGTASILIFYRGNWCPLCVAQVKEMAANYNKIKDLGARTIFVSPQPQSHTVSLAKKFGTDGLEFMNDSDNAAAKILGIVSKLGTPMGVQALGYDNDTVLPTVIISDKHGRVVWTHETDNYRVRPEPETYLAVLKGMGLQSA